jgi:uncharacterized protein YndB with AHSA1/START domain
MFKKVLIALVVVLAVFAVVVSRQPGDFKVSRSAVVNAPPAKVFAIVNDMHRWNDWSPWAKMDPAMKVTFEGPASGVGASESWSGSSKVGQGKMTITESKPSQKVGMQLEFLKPMKATNQVEFNLKPEGKGTSVEWAMSGKNNFISKAFGLVMNMDKMIGGDFEKGLANLNEVAQAKK